MGPRPRVRKAQGDPGPTTVCKELRKCSITEGHATTMLEPAWAVPLAISETSDLSININKDSTVM